MERPDAVDAVHWRHNDYAKIPQLHGRWFLHGICRGHLSNVLSPFPIVSGIGFALLHGGYYHHLFFGC